MQVVIGGVVFTAVALVAASWMGTLRPELKFAGGSFERGEMIAFALSVCSKGVLPMSTDDGKPRWRITDGSGEVVADSSHQVFTMELKTLAWSPRQCRQVLSVDWDQREWNQLPILPGETLGIPRKGDPVLPGRYDLRVGWGALQDELASFEIVE
ncbi:MAG: hypothetical protein ACR2H3_00120 [Acidimicrobiales bacterium]